jgi:DNA-binding NarL/FixJ family response regulator
MSLPRIVLADDQPMFLEGLRRVLLDEFEILAAVSCGQALITAVETLQPDLAVVDASLSCVNALDVLRHFQAKTVPTRFVMLIGKVDIGLAAASLRLGAAACVSKQSAMVELVAAIREAQAGETYIAPQFEHAVRRMLAHLPGRKSTSLLTKRELDVLQLLAQGNTFKEIATALAVSPRTVEFHRNNIALKTGLNTTAELARYATRLGLVPDK